MCAQSEWLSQLLFSDLREFQFYHFISFCSCNIGWRVKNPFVDVLDCTMRFLFIDHNTWFLAVYRSNTGFIFLGYVITQLPGGWLGTRFGGKYLLGLGVLCTSVLTIFTPLAARHSAGMLILVRILEGLGQVN